VPRWNSLTAAFQPWPTAAVYTSLPRTFQKSFGASSCVSAPDPLKSNRRSAAYT
jgi:hypothetical protein